MSILHFPAGRPKDNYAEIVTVNNTTVTRTITVPVGERWRLLGAHLKNGDNVNRACLIIIKNSSSEIILIIAYDAALATTQYIHYPSNLTTTRNLAAADLVLLGGWTINFTLTAGGASAGGTSTSAALVLEVS